MSLMLDLFYDALSPDFSLPKPLLSLDNVELFCETFSWNSSRSYEVATGDEMVYVSGDLTDLNGITGERASSWLTLISLSFSESSFLFCRFTVFFI